jgi:hypothetical protein
MLGCDGYFPKPLTLPWFPSPKMTMAWESLFLT